MRARSSRSQARSAPGAGSSPGCIAGLQRPDGGKVAFGGRDAPPRSPREALHAAACLPARGPQARGNHARPRCGGERRRRSPVAAAVAVRATAHAPAHGRRQCRSLGVRAADVFTPVRTLSGGKQQKIMLGRWLGTGARMFVFDEPTAGIDVGAKLEIYDLLRRLAADGAGVLFFSSDLEEITLVAHRAVVLCKGRVAGVCSGADMTEDRMLSLLVGAA
ncbi:MAG: ATP-binding cassette domain-containing protein [Solirubrobacterales bacterium]